MIPPLLKEDQSIKEYVERRNETITQVNSLIHNISQDVNMSLLQKSLLQLVELDNFYDNFIKEINQATIIYTSYRKKADLIAQHQWPTNEEYQDWVKKYDPNDE